MKNSILKILTAVLLMFVLLVSQVQAATTINRDVSKNLDPTKRADLKLKLTPVASIELLCRNDGVIISWSNIGVAEKVVIEKSLDQKNYTVYATVETNGNGVEDRDVVKMQTYYYRIKALYSGGLESSYSNIVSATPLQDGLPVEWDPSPMISAALSGEGNAVSLNWSFENTNYIKIYKINLERSIDGVKYTVIGSYDPAILSSKDSYVSKNQNYFYRIHIAYGSLKNRYSNVVSVKPTQDGIPGDPPFDNKISDNGIDTTADTKTTNINNKIDPNIPEAKDTIKKIDKLKIKTIITFTEGLKKYSVNGVEKDMDTVPVTVNNRLMLPVRYAAEPLGAKVDWLETEKKATVTLGSKVVELWINRNTAKVNGVSTPVDPSNGEVMPLKIDNRTMVPMRFLAESLGCAVDWDSAAHKATITF